MTRPSRFATAGFAAILAGIFGTTAHAQLRGEGTMLVRQSTNCSGTGNASTVHFPFSALFTGFDPRVVGEVTAFTQPGGVEVGHRTVTVDDHGNRCELVDGTVPPGQYKIVYDFGSGTGKQKVISLVAEPTPTPTATAAPTATGAPTAGPTPTGTVSPSTTPSSPSGAPTIPSTSSSSTYVAGRIRSARYAAERSWRAPARILTAVLMIAVALLVSGVVLVAIAGRRARTLST